MDFIISDIQVEEYNKFIGDFGNWSLFQSDDWRQVQELLGVTNHQLGIWEKTKLIGVFQFFVIRARRGTFLHVRQGPVLIPDYVIDTDLWDTLIAYFKEQARTQHAWFVRIGPRIANTKAYQDFFKRLGCKPAPIHAMDGEYGWILDINKSEEELLADMRKTTRYLIRQAQKLGVSVSSSLDSNDFLTLYEETSRRHGFIKHHGIREEFEHFSRKNECKLFVARYEHKILASALIIYFGNQAIYHHGASVTSKVPASYLLQWESIKEAKKRGKKIYNFWGIAPSENTNHPWRGITLFKQGFGGRVQEFMHVMDIPVSPFYALTYAVENYRKMRKGY
ncbi:peptidoglycan bridge formation glycyltransferase FemA/FemB family protein [Candidatus Microgenomates bacterium]|nr:MAG: peptidoglycan bridge formation glycyltransferase FemA/FemB family protein [Candidatus Microgenomates bacterium]